MKMTIKDLAKLLSLAPSTISRALNDHPDISEKVKVRVKAAAERFGYMPNLHARYFRKKKTNLVALILPEFDRFFTPDLLNGVESFLKNHNYSLITFATNNSYKREVEIVKHCLSWVVEGVIISLSDETTNVSHLNMLRDAGIQVVMVDRVIEGENYGSVTINDEDAAYQATKALITKGRKNIGGIFAAPGLNTTANRLSGFKKAIAEHALPRSGKTLIQDPHGIVNEDIVKALQSWRGLDGLFVMTDELLRMVMRELQDHPEYYSPNIGIVAISDGSLPYFFTPRISHIFHNGFQQGYQAAEKVVSMIHETDPEEPHILLPVSLVDLGSL